MKLLAIVRALVSAVVFILVLELCARLDDFASYGAPVLSNYGQENLYEQDRLGRKGRPGGRYRDWQLNGLGFRGPELHSGGVRIICIGASETFGLHEGPGWEYPRQLEDLLNAGDESRPFQVINSAHAGETVRTATVRVPEIVDAIHPQVALIYPALASYIDLSQFSPAPGRGEAGAGWPGHFQWRIVRNLRETAERVLPMRVQSYLRHRDIQAALAHRGPALDRIPEENVNAFRHDLEQLVQSLRSRGVQPVLLTHATRFGPGLATTDIDTLTRWRKYYPVLKESGFLDMESRMNDAIRRLAQDQNLILIDTARQIPPGEQNFADYVHFTRAGATILARFVARSIEPTLQQYTHRKQQEAKVRTCKDEFPSTISK